MVSAALTSVCAKSGSFPLARISAARRSSTFGYSWIRPEISRRSSSMTLSSVSICRFPSRFANKKPHSEMPWGLARETRYMKRLSLVGLPQRGGLTFLSHELSCGADCLHRDGIMFGRVADDHAKLTAFTAVNDHLGYHLV